MKQSNSKTYLYFILFLSLLIFLIGGTFYYIFTHHYLVQLEPDIAEESTESILNPYMGWYYIHAYMLSETAEFTSADIAEENSEIDTRLVLVEINLKEYRAQDLSEKALTDLNTILSGISRTNKHVILRFLYDWDGDAITSEPDSIDQILRHMEQVADVVNEYTDTVYLMQGLFVGDFAEMHSSNYVDDESLITLAEKLDDVIDSSIFLSVRTPQYYRLINQTYATIDPSDAFDGSLSSRMGLFNDGMLGSITDLGTYSITSIDMNTSSSFEERGDRAQEISFQNALCQYVPNGGEVVINNSYNDLTNAITDLSAMHVSYLNIGYDEDVISKWKSSIYTSEDAFNQSTGYNYITAHMGYRFVLTDASIDRKNTSTFSNTSNITLSVENTGFTSCYRPLDCQLTLINQDTYEISTLDVNTDPRTWLSGETVDLTISLPNSELTGGTYRIYLTLTDPSSGEIVSFANTNCHALYGCSIGTLKIDSGFTLEQ